MREHKTSAAPVRGLIAFALVAELQLLDPLGILCAHCALRFAVDRKAWQQSSSSSNTRTFTAEDDAAASTEGKPRFNGEPTRLAEYVFRVRARMYEEKAMSREEKDKLGPLGLRLVEGLSGTALRLAQTMSLEDLAKEDGAEKLLTALEGQLKSKRLQQAWELYAAGAQSTGSCPGKVASRCRIMCFEGDCSAEIALPDLVLAEQLLASSSISHDHQLLVRTALKTEIAFDAVADELIAQHGKTHERENRWSPTSPW